jgi:starvation-inducible outer membrane lipoprotein
MIRLLLIALALMLTGCATNDDNDVIDQAIAARIYRGSTSDTVPYMNIPK